MIHVNRLTGMHIIDMQVLQNHGADRKSPEAGHVCALVTLLQVDCWQAYFQRVYLKPQTDATMHTMLLGAWSRSHAKQYHDNNTKFKKVFKLKKPPFLLKGQTYTCPPDAKAGMYEALWRLTDYSRTNFVASTHVLVFAAYDLFWRDAYGLFGMHLVVELGGFCACKGSSANRHGA